MIQLALLSRPDRGGNTCHADPCKTRKLIRYALRLGCYCESTRIIQVALWTVANFEQGSRKMGYRYPARCYLVSESMDCTLHVGDLWDCEASQQIASEPQRLVVACSSRILRLSCPPALKCGNISELSPCLLCQADRCRTYEYWSIACLAASRCTIGAHTRQPYR